MNASVNTLPDGFLDRLRAATSLWQIVSRWVVWDLRKSKPDKGDFWGPCPFHDDASSSFHVDDHKGYYYCFGCHAKGDAITFLKEKQSLPFLTVVRTCAFMAGMEKELQMPTAPAHEPPTILELKEIIVASFTKENFLEVGILTGWSDHIQSHSRLLRSLNFNDPDYGGNVLELLGAMQSRKDGSFAKVQAYVAKTFSEQSQTVQQVAF